MDRRKFLKNTGWSFLGLAASGSLLGSCAAGSKEAKKIMPSASNLKMYWGDLHNHCNITYGHGDMRDAFEAAKGQLDFVSVTPHAMWPDIPGADDPRLKWVIDYHTGAFKRLREGGYEKYVKMTNEYNKEGEFLTFVGYEAHSMEHGDHVALNYDLDAPLVECTSIEDWKEKAKGHKVFVTPHHMGYQGGYRGYNWKCFTEGDITPFVEMYSRHGLAESDRRKVSLILDNLISNSIKYTCQHGNVWVKCSLTDGKLVLEVVDDGIGISTQAQKKLFNRFYRAENAANSKETGSGIGLLLTKKMTLLHKGSIDFSSTEGVGTTFRIQLPVSQSDYNKTELIQKDFHPKKEVQQEKQPDEAGKIKILLVEDNEELREYLARYLKQDYSIVESADGQAALEIVRKENPDFIISDVMMPLLSGTELCKQLKSNIETCHIPLILLTSLAEREDIIKGLNAGADDYITKPFDPAVLKSKIASIINNRSLYRKKYIDKSAFNDESLLVNELDKQFMEQVVEYIEEKMMNEDFSIDTLAIEMAMSRSVFFKKIKSLTGQNPQEFIRDIKMKRAATLLREHKYSIGEIAYLTGYPNAKYFSTAFKKYYGCTPSSFMEDEISAPSYSDEV